MPYIQQLSPHVADLIAAGEVVEGGGGGGTHDHHRVGVDGVGPAGGVDGHDLALLRVHGNLGA